MSARAPFASRRWAPLGWLVALGSAAGLAGSATGVAFALRVSGTAGSPDAGTPRAARFVADGSAPLPVRRLAQSGVVPIDLGALPGGTDSRALGVNDRGQVVGWSYVTVGGHGAVHAFSWTAAGGLVDLHSLVTLGGGDSAASEVSDDGQVVGWSFTPGDEPHAYSWTAAGGVVDLGTLPGGSESRATRVNDSGQVVGWADTTGAQPGATSGVRHAFSWTAAGGMVDLGTFGGSAATAAAVNDSGQVVGYGDTAAGSWHAFSWSAAGGMVDLGTLGGATSTAHAVNKSGQVVGQSATAAAAVHAFSWSAAGGMVDLGTLGGATSAARGVNDGGQVVGYSDTASGAVHGFSWTKAGGMVDLGPLPGDTGSDAEAVNDSGEVVGWSEDAGGHTHAVLWRLPAAPISSLRLAPVSFRAERHGPSILSKGTRGTKVQFDVLERTLVTFTIEQVRPGRRRGMTCLPEARSRRGLPRCVRYVPLRGSFAHSWQPGSYSFRFTGVIGNAPLEPGRYRLVAAAPGTAGRRSAPIHVDFTVEP